MNVETIVIILPKTVSENLLAFLKRVATKNYIEAEAYIEVVKSVEQNTMTLEKFLDIHSIKNKNLESIDPKVMSPE